MIIPQLLRSPRAKPIIEAIRRMVDGQGDRASQTAFARGHPHWKSYQSGIEMVKG
jgi:hypothetical protein